MGNTWGWREGGRGRMPLPSWLRKSTPLPPLIQCNINVPHVYQKFLLLKILPPHIFLLWEKKSRLRVILKWCLLKLHKNSIHRTVPDPLVLKEDSYKCGLLKFSRSMALSARVFSSCIKHGSRLKGVSWDQDLASPQPEIWILLLLNTTTHHPNTRLLRIRLRVGISMHGHMQIYGKKYLKFGPLINMKVTPTDNLSKCKTDLSLWPCVLLDLESQLSMRRQNHRKIGIFSFNELSPHKADVIQPNHQRAG